MGHERAGFNIFVERHLHYIWNGSETKLNFIALANTIYHSRIDTNKGAEHQSQPTPLYAFQLFDNIGWFISLIYVF